MAPCDWTAHQCCLSPSRESQRLSFSTSPSSLWAISAISAPLSFSATQNRISASLSSLVVPISNLVVSLSSLSVTFILENSVFSVGDLVLGVSKSNRVVSLSSLVVPISNLVVSLSKLVVSVSTSPSSLPVTFILDFSVMSLDDLVLVVSLSSLVLSLSNLLESLSNLVWNLDSISLSWTRDSLMDPYTQQCSFQNLLNSQTPNTQWNESVSASVPREPYQTVSASDASVFSSQWNEDGNDDVEIVSGRKERRKWSPVEDVVLISAWLNTSKDPVVGNEQKAITFWKRIASYFAASPKLAGLQKRGPVHCKARWGKINEGVCKFVGSYEAATKQRSSGQNEDDILKMAHAIYFNDYKKKYTIEHAWLELRHDQKWRGASTTKDKVREDDNSARPAGVKAAKAKAKKPVSKPTLEEEGKEFHNLWEIRQNDFALKDKLNKQKLLESLIVKTEPLTELELALKDQLIKDMLA
ncbi:glutathione S-transferase T3-like [Brassica napus]|uniref:glutathione S-transferase T3-like n=1 Tax=Brassica napus TaxID=3708 RepID=UPI00207883D9|nr:glutathione S-transferase T3-like [Brassica napus]